MGDETGANLQVERVRIDLDRPKYELKHVRDLLYAQLPTNERDLWETIRVTFDDLDKAVDATHEIVLPYVSLITGPSSLA